MPRPSADELLALAVKQIKDDIPEGDGPAPTLARRIGMPYARVYRWFQPGNGLNAEGAIAILDAFGWLRIPEDDLEAAGLPPDPLAKIAAGVAALEKGQARVIRLLQAEQAARRSPATETPKARERGKR